MPNVTALEGSRGLSRFIDVPWKLYGQDHEHWVPPLRRMRRTVLDVERNPFFRDAGLRLFVALRDGAPVGRIAAIENRAHNRYQGDRTGFFGFLDAIDDAEVVEALLDAAGSWLAGRGLRTLRGPTNPSTNYEAGMLVSGFERPHTFMTTWNPPYLPALVQEAGLESARDLLAYHLDLDELDGGTRRRISALAEVGRRRYGLRFRELDMARFEEEMRACWRIYTSAWSDNWGFVPPSEEEFLHLTRGLKPLLLSDTAIGAEVDGEPVGFLLAVPDYNRALKRIGTGRLLPFGWLRLLLARREAPWFRVIAMGVKPGYRRRAVFPLLMERALRRGPEYGTTDVEASWILEDNLPMTKTLEAVGARPHRRWRIYERPIPR